METKKEDTTHPLLNMRLVPLDWRGWKLQWEACTSPETAMALLHAAFDVPVAHVNEMLERVLLFFRLADGHRDEHGLTVSSDFKSEVEREMQHLRLPSGHARAGCLYEPHKIRMQVATKAFRVLCEEWLKFRWERSNNNEYGWMQWFLNDHAFDRLLWFFDDSDRRGLFRGNLRDPDSKVHQADAIARRFAYDLIQYTWSFQRETYDWHWLHPDSAEFARWANIFRAARPRYVRILNALGRLDLLTHANYVADDASLKALEELALRSQQYPEFKTIEESASRGNPAAHTLLVARAIRKEVDAWEKKRRRGR
ncbi:MAG: hypothetical protein QY323_02385 [Patescibacteria group bacterium]|nr:MAG: hypothetical protein QY323_02385 [Patescibacteria group bacterium]